jgi:hypothetical protein
LEDGIGHEPVTHSPSIGNQDGKIDEQNQGDEAVNIFCEADNTFCDAIKRDPAEAASAACRRALEIQPRKSVGAILGIIERLMKAGTLSEEEGYRWLGWQKSG